MNRISSRVRVESRYFLFRFQLKAGQFPHTLRVSHR